MKRLMPALSMFLIPIAMIFLAILLDIYGG